MSGPMVKLIVSFLKVCAADSRRATLETVPNLKRDEFLQCNIKYPPGLALADIERHTYEPGCLQLLSTEK